MNCKTALQTLLDQVDYTKGNCRPNEMVGAVLPKEIIKLCRQAILEDRTCEHKTQRVNAYGILVCKDCGAIM